MDQMIRIDYQGFSHIHEEIRQFQRPGEGFHPTEEDKESAPLHMTIRL